MMLRYTLIVRLASILEYALCVFPFAAAFKRRRPFPLRLLASLACCLIVGVINAFLQTVSNGFWMHILISLLAYSGLGAGMVISWQMPVADYALCLCAGTAVQALTGRLTELFYILAGSDSYHTIAMIGGIQVSQAVSWIIYAVLHLGLILGLWFIFRGKEPDSERQYSGLDVLYSVSVMIITTVLQTYSRPLEAGNPEMAAVVRALVMCWSVLVLVFRTILLAHSRANEQLRITRHLLNAERKQFDAVRDDMEMINIKCHDIRHQLDQYAGRLTEKEFQELRQAITIYDHQMKTGNDILNMVIYKKQAIMEQRHITFSCMADARCLSFMASTDIFSMMNNALDNAIEAVSRLEDESLRLISLHVQEENGIANIHLTNYFLPGNVENGVMPQTIKEESFNHGYGMRSIAYVAEKYEGMMNFRVEENLFHLNICIPIPQNAEDGNAGA